MTKTTIHNLIEPALAEALSSHSQPAATGGKNPEHVYLASMLNRFSVYLLEQTDEDSRMSMLKVADFSSIVRDFLLKEEVLK